MALAETARLLASYEFQNKGGPGVNQAIGQLGRLEGASNRTVGVAGLLSRSVGGLGKVAGTIGNAFSTLTSRIGQLAGIAGIGGLGIGLFSLGGLIAGSITKVRDFAGEVLRLKGFAKLTTEEASGLASTFEHFGVDADAAGRLVGIAEKNLFKYGGTAKAAKKFQEQYGFSLRDTAGHLKDTNELLLSAADYYVRNGNAAQRAAALSAIFGRTYLTLIPVLSRGRKGIQEVEAEARRLGLTLNDKNLADFIKYREATRSWGTALAGLKVQLGADLVPLLTRLATGATAFVANNRDKIIGFVNSIIDYGQKVAALVSRIVTKDIVPAIQGVLKFWNGLPAPLRSILGRTIGGSLTIRFLTGIDPIGLAGAGAAKVGAAIAGAIAGGLIGKLGGFFGGLLGRTAAQKLIPQVIVGTAAGVVPVFVTNPGFGGPGGIGDLIGKAAPAAGAGGLFAGISIASVAAAAVAGLGLIVGGGIVLGLLGGFKNRGPTATSTGVEGGLSVGPKGQIRGPAGTAGDPIHTTDTRTEAAIERQAQRTGTATQNLYNLGTSARAREAGPLPVNKPITAAEFERILKTTPFLGPRTGYKSTFETTTTATPARGGDPYGQNFLHLVSTLQNPKAPAVMFEIKGHLAELRNLEAYYIAHGDIAAATKVQGVIDSVDKLIGITEKQHPATVAAQKATRAAIVTAAAVTDHGSRRVANILGTVQQATERAHTAISAGAQRTAQHLSHLEGLGSATAANTAATARKNFSPKVNVGVNVTNQISVSGVYQQIVRVTSGMFAGKPVGSSWTQ